MDSDPPAPDCPHCGGANEPVICPRCILSRLIAGPATPTLPLDWDLPQAAHTAPSLRSYEILNRLGQGGMGEVFLSRHRSTGRLVAVKLLRPEVPFARVQREVAALSKLSHESIVGVIDHGLENERAFIVMDYVEGEDLQRARASGDWSPRRCATLLHQIADALVHAHEKGVLHRDLKPHNIMVDRKGRPHLTDFGLAWLHELPGLTLTGDQLGTPAYIAPEQLAIERKDVGFAPTIDVYGLGATLYFLLTGRPPFKGGLNRVLGPVSRAEPSRPSHINPDVDADLETLCLGCLEQVPKDRYATAIAVREELSRWLERRPIHRRPVGLAGQVRRFAQRQPSLAALASAVLLLLVAGLVLVGLKNRAIRATNANLQHEISSMRLVVANRMLEADDAPGAIETLTDQLLAHPRDVRAAIRLASTLDSRKWLKPEGELTLPGLVTAAVWHPDAEHLLTVHSAQAIGPRFGTLWHARTGSRVAGPLSLGSMAGESLFSPDGQWLLTAFVGECRLRDPKSLAAIGGPLSQSSNSCSVAWLPDSREVAILDDHGATLIPIAFPAIPGRSSGRVFRTEGTPLCVAVSSDGRRLAVGTLDRRIWVWDLPSGKPTCPPIPLSHAAVELCFGSNLLAAAQTPLGLDLISLPDGTTIRSWPRAKRGEFAPGTSPLLLSFDHPASLELVNERTGQVLREWPHGTAPRPAFFAGSHSLLVFDTPGAARPYALDTLQPWSEPVRCRSQSAIASLSPDARSLATVGRDTTVQLWKTPTSTHPARIRSMDPADHIVLGRGWAALAAGSRIRTFRTSREQQPLHSWDAGERLRLLVADSSEEDGLLTVLDGGDTTIWRSTTHREFCRLRTTRPRVAALHGLRAATLEDGWNLRQWDLSHPNEAVATCNVADPVSSPPPPARRGCLTYSIDGSLLLVGGLDGLVQALFAGTTDVAWAARHHGEITRIVMNPVGQTVATASTDRTAQIRNLRTGEPLGKSIEQDDAIVVLEFAPTGSRLLTGTSDGRLSLRDLPGGNPRWSNRGPQGRLVFAGFAGPSRVVRCMSGGFLEVLDADTGQRLEEPRRISTGHGTASALGDGVSLWWVSPENPAHRCFFLPEDPAPEWLPRLARIVAQGASRDSTAQAFETLAQSIAEESPPTAWTEWGRDFLGLPRDERGTTTLGSGQARTTDRPSASPADSP